MPDDTIMSQELRTRKAQSQDCPKAAEEKDSVPDNSCDENEVAFQHKEMYAGTIFTVCEELNATRKKRHKTEEEKRVQRLEANRRSARESRNRKKDKFEALKQSCSHLAKENEQLQRENEELRENIAELREKYGGKGDHVDQTSNASTNSFSASSHVLGVHHEYSSRRSSSSLAAAATKDFVRQMNQAGNADHPTVTQPYNPDMDAQRQKMCENLYFNMPFEQQFALSQVNPMAEQVAAAEKVDFDRRRLPPFTSSMRARSEGQKAVTSLFQVVLPTQWKQEDE